MDQDVGLRGSESDMKLIPLERLVQQCPRDRLARASRACWPDLTLQLPVEGAVGSQCVNAMPSANEVTMLLVCAEI